MVFFLYFATTVNNSVCCSMIKFWILFCRGREQVVLVREGTRHTLSVWDAVAAAFISRKAAVVLVPFLLPVSENVSCSLLMDQESIYNCFFFYLKQIWFLLIVYCYDHFACLCAIKHFWILIYVCQFLRPSFRFTLILGPRKRLLFLLHRACFHVRAKLDLRVVFLANCYKFVWMFCIWFPR